MEIETLTTAGDGVGSEPRPRYALGLCGSLLAVLGLALAIARPYVAEALKPPPPPDPQQRLSRVLAEAGEKLVDRMLDKVRGRPAAGQAGPPPPVQGGASLVAVPLGRRHCARSGRLAVGHGRLDPPRGTTAGRAAP